MNHYALENSDPFQIRFIRGVCSSSSGLCVGGAGDGTTMCVETTDCPTGPLNFVSGETKIYDEDGNFIKTYPFTDVEFELVSLNVSHEPNHVRFVKTSKI